MQYEILYIVHGSGSFIIENDLYNFSDGTIILVPPGKYHVMKISSQDLYERYVIINGKQYTHIIDAKTGYPVQNMLSVSVIAPKGIDSDALSTSVFLKGAPLAEKICRENPKIQILIIRRDPQERTRILIERFGDIWDRDLKMESPELPAFEE